MKALMSLYLFVFIVASCNTQKTNNLGTLQTVETNPKVVKTGIEVLRENNFDLLKNKKVGLVTNPTGVDHNLKSTVDILFEAKDVNLVALYGPEHGVRGNFSAGDKVVDAKDPKTGLPVYSLYGKTRKPTPEMLQNIDVLVYDIQDIGCRSYTYISTMGLVMEAAAENGIEVIVLDRPNPLSGERVEGNITDTAFISFVSQFQIPYIYGLTCGELAQMLNNESMLTNKVKCKLTVVPMQGWKRSMTFEETGLEWVPASPHIPHKNSAFYYTLTGIAGELNGNMIGVGYTIPFQAFATSWLDADLLADEMNALNLKGVRFRPTHFKPYYLPQKGAELHGVQIHITDFKEVTLTNIQFYLMEKAYKQLPDSNLFAMYPDRHRMFDLVSGSDTIRKTFSKNFKYEDVKHLWEKDAVEFKAKSQKYYLYP